MTEETKTKLKRIERNYRIGAIDDKEREFQILEAFMRGEGLSADAAYKEIAKYEDSLAETEQSESGSGVDNTGV